MKEFLNTQLRMHLATFLAMCIALSTTAFAQNKPVEKKNGKKDNTEAAWKLQAQSVSEELGLSKDQTAKLTAAYLAAEKGHKQALKELPEEKDKDKSRAATQAAIEKDRANFAASLKDVLTEELVAKVLPTLGSFNAKWDGFVVALQNLKLEKAAMKSAMKLVINYVTEYEAASVESMKSLSHKPNSKPFKAKLDTGLSGILSADQMKMWKTATATSDGKNKSDTTIKSDKTKKSDKSKKK
ncbi:MAG: hypothetical protein NTZ35_01160 [Ignavibacteriales bacterium]|nr:hypothetical protein [Ignavibacteriales bacterium]